MAIANPLQGGGSQTLQQTSNPQGNNVNPQGSPVIYDWNYGGGSSAPAPAPTYSDIFGGTHGSLDQANAVNQAYNTALQSRTSALSGSASGVNSLEQQLADKSNSFTRDYGSQVDALNLGRSQNQLNLRRSMSNIASGIRQGVNSGNVSLANMNALDSGAARALVQAYSTVGNKQAGEARNQSALQDQQFGTQEQTLARYRDDTIASLNQFANVEIDRIGRELEAKLATIDQQAEQAGVPADAINVINDKNGVTQDAFRRIQVIKANRDKRIAEAKLLSPEEVMARAVQMDQAGAAADPFQVSEPEVVAPGGGEAGLPVLTRGRKEDNPAGLFVGA